MEAKEKSHIDRIIKKHKAEPEALVGFAGPRVIEQTIRQKLPEGFQRSEFLLQHGVIDMIVPRRRLRGQLASLFEMLAVS